MKQKAWLKLPVVFITILLILISGQNTDSFTNSATAAEIDRKGSPQAAPIPGPMVFVKVGKALHPTPFVRPPAAFLRPSRAKTATITVDFQGAWDINARNAFSFAASIWETQITSSVPIVIRATWDPMASNILGGAYSPLVWKNVPNEPVTATYYPSALANALAGTDLDAGTGLDGPEIIASFNKNRSDWYFGTDGNASGTEFDFVSVVLHEIGHGLGFFGSMTVDDGVLDTNGQHECNGITNSGCWGRGSGIPYIYDRFVQNGSGQSLINTAIFLNPSISLGNQLTGGNIFFNGLNAVAANGGNPPELFAPGGWQQGSSYSHLDESVFPSGNPNALMTPRISPGEAHHDPGPIMIGMFTDMGWQTNNPPTITGLPDQTIPTSTSSNNAIDLWGFSSDDETIDNLLTFTISNSPDANAGISIDNNRYIDISPTLGWENSTTVTIQVTDQGGLTDTDSFLVTVANSPPAFLTIPTILMQMDTSNSQAVDLWNYVSDLQTPVSSITFTLTNTGDVNAGVSLNGNRYVKVTPTSGWTGMTTITLKAEDDHLPPGFVTTTFDVVIAPEIFKLYLPAIQNN